MHKEVRAKMHILSSLKKKGQRLNVFLETIDRCVTIGWSIEKSIWFSAASRLGTGKYENEVRKKKSSLLELSYMSTFIVRFAHDNRTQYNIVSQVFGFAQLKEMADDRVNIGGTIIGAPIVDQQLAQYILTDHQDADCKPMIRLILLRQL